MTDEYIRKADAIKQCGFGMTSLHIADNLRKIPPADVVQVRHGQWQNTRPSCMSDSIVCSECGYDSIANYTYCPNCGAKMDKE